MNPPAAPVKVTNDTIWQIAPITALLLLHLLFDFMSRAGIRGVNILGEVLMVVGWVIGQMLANADHLFYATVCNPQELTCQRVRSELKLKNWKNAWGLLESTKDERTRLPIRNILTGTVMMGVGLWVISSSRSWLGWGVVLGLNTRLFAELVGEVNWKKWYWVFDREFHETEHRGLLIAWGIALGIQYLMMVGR